LDGGKSAADGRRNEDRKTSRKGVEKSGKLGERDLKKIGKKRNAARWTAQVGGGGVFAAEKKEEREEGRRETRFWGGLGGGGNCNF